MKRTHLAAATAAAAGLALSAHAQSVVNGGFESGSLSGWNLDGDQTYIGVTNGNFDGFTPHGGSYMSYQGPVGGNAGFDQVVTGLHAGDHVTLDFWYASDGATPAFSCVFDNQTLVSLTNDTTHTSWTEFNFAVTISADNPTLSFLFRNDPAWDVLDDVSVAPFNGGTGACCTPLNGCTITSQASCAVQNGVYSGDNSTCATVNCPTGACCHSDFTCTVGSPGACTSSGGTYAGDGSTCATANCPGPTLGPDVIVGEVYDISRDGVVGGITAYSIGTDSCNLGDIGVTWVAGTNQHPVISGNMFRLKTVSGAARFEQVGLSWYKHGFEATNGSFCGTCHTSDGTHLGPGGCSDVYYSGLNGDQGNMGARSEANGTTGVFTYPSVNQGNDGSVIGKRCQCLTADVDPAQNSGALYFADAHYLVPDDAQYSHNGANATNGLNNYSYRQITASTMLSGAPSFAALSHTHDPAIQAWKDQDPTVTEVNAEYIDSTLSTNIVSRFIVSAKATDLGNGSFHYEYAVYNVNADRSGGSFSVPIPAGAQITNVGFHAPFYHSGEVYDNTAWNSAVTGSAVTWTPHPFSPAANENALRWGTLYNFRFDANIAPGTGSATLGLFKAGSPSSLVVGGLPVPGGFRYANCDFSTGVPFLNVGDFTCFLQKFGTGNPYANCDASTAPPVLNVQDFTCFLQKFAPGCSAP